MKRGFFRVHKVYGVKPAFYPSDKAAKEIMEGYEHDDIVRLQASKPRHPGHNAKYWAMLGLVHEASNVSDLFATPQHLHDAIKGALGYWTEIRLPTGQTFKKIDSTAFESMDQAAFQDFYNKAVDVIVTQIVPNLDREDLEREVMELVK